MATNVKTSQNTNSKDRIAEQQQYKVARTSIVKESEQYKVTDRI